MNKLTTGLIIGGLAGIAGAGYMSMNSSTKNKVMRKGKQMMTKAGNALEDVSTEVW